MCLMSLTSLWFPSLHLIELGTLMQMCPICEHAQEFVFLQQDFCQTSPKKTEKVICMCFELLFWILCCKMERDQQWLLIPPLTMSRWLPHGPAWILLAAGEGCCQSLSFCWEELQDCAHACASSYPRLFCPHLWQVGKGGDCHSVPGPTSFWLPDTSCFYVLR